MAITYNNLINVTQDSNYNSISFFDTNYINSLDMSLLALPSLYTSFKALPEFDVKFDIMLKQFKQSGRLVYEYNPFHNLILASPTSLTVAQETFYFQTGDVCDFNISGSLIPLDLNHPLEIEIQPSYDGSINLIALDNLNQAILINSRFTAEELDTYRIIDRKGSNDTNLYEELYLEAQTKLYKTSNIISQLTLDNVEIGGKLLCGSYVFYFKYADLDGNETDVIAESGIVPCYIGNINDPKSIRGGITNELTDKLIKLKLKHLDKGYDYINLYYVRTTSDYGEVAVQSLFKILEKYIINTNDLTNDELIITVSGYESSVETTLDEIIQEYNVIDQQKSITQVQNRLFQANLTLEQTEYKDLEDIALRFYPTVNSNTNIGNLNRNYEVSITNSGLEYYNPLNVTNYLGYWNKEIYRTGIVFIFDKNKLSPVFNTHGGQNIGELDLSIFSTLTDYKTGLSTGGNITNTTNCYSSFDLFNTNGDRLYIPTDANRNIINPTGNKINENNAGVFNIFHGKGPITANGIKPLGLQFSTEKTILEYLQTVGVKGFFFVRQKRIPNILFQGITQGYAINLEVPLLFTLDKGNVLGHRIEYISAREKLNTEVKTTGVKTDPTSGATTTITFANGTSVNSMSNNNTAFTNRFNLLTSNNYIPSGTVFSLDISLNTELMSDLLVGNDLKYSKCTHSFVNNALSQEYTYIGGKTLPNRSFASDTFLNVVDKTIYDLKVTLVEDGHPVKYSGTKRFRGRAGIQEEAFRFESTGVTDDAIGPNIPDPDLAIRGLFSTYAGLEGTSYMPSGTLIDVHTPDFAWENMSNYFKVRQNSFQSYSAITDKFDILTLLADLTVTQKPYWSTVLYRGDCFVGNYTQRINRNFQDNELPLNDTILGNTVNTGDVMSTVSLWYSKLAVNGIPFLEGNYYLVNRLDVNAVQLGHWLTFKTCSNNNLAYRTIDKLHTNEYALTGSYRGFFPFKKISWTSESKIPESTLINKGYSMTLPLKDYFINPDVPYIKDKFNNRIMFSEIHVNDSFRNGYRIFKGLNYKDYNVGWGSITKILEWRNNILIVFEHGIGIIPVNESLLLATGSNTGDVYIRGVGVLPPTLNTISDTFGSQWKDSITKTSRYIYGVDHVAKKLWRTDGEKIELISDFKIQSFLNEGITLNSREKTPTLGIRNIKTHYNAFKEDVMFTYYDVDSVVDEKKWNMCYNEQLSRWITRYDWEPLQSENINNIFFSYDRESPEKLLWLASSYINSLSSGGIVLTNYEILNALTIDLSHFNLPWDPTLIYTTLEEDLIRGSGVSLKYRLFLKLKSHVLESYYPTYEIHYTDKDLTGYDNNLFQLVTTTDGVEITSILFPGALTSENKYLFSIKIKAILKRADGSVWDTIYDVVHLRIDRNFYANDNPDPNDQNFTSRDKYDRAYTTRFWKHGQAGIFDYVSEVKPTTWYGTTRPFEFEFIMLDNPTIHKILENLIIVSNNVEPESFTFTVTTDSYTLLILPYDIVPYGAITSYNLNRRGLDISTTLTDDYVLTTVSNTIIKMDQIGLNTWKVGRLLGNMHYKENFWYIDVQPIQLLQKGNYVYSSTDPIQLLHDGSTLKGKQSRIKDKLIRIRIKYSGKDLAIITLLNSIYVQTFN